MPKAKTQARAKGAAGKVAEGYTHPDKTLLMRLEVGTQAQFRKKKPPVTRRRRQSRGQAVGVDSRFIRAKIASTRSPFLRLSAKFVQQDRVDRRG